MDKLVHNVVEKPLTLTAPRPYDLGTVATRDNEEGPGRHHDRLPPTAGTIPPARRPIAHAPEG